MNPTNGVLQIQLVLCVVFLVVIWFISSDGHDCYETLCDSIFLVGVCRLMKSQ